MGKRVTQLNPANGIREDDVLLLDNNGFGESKKITFRELKEIIIKSVPQRHDILGNREFENQHPIKAITGLKSNLDNLNALGLVVVNGKICIEYEEVV